MAEEITKRDVLKLIELRKDDTLLTHFICIILRKSIAMGEVGNRKIKVWSPNPWNRAFYPIFEFEFNAENHLIKISNRVNPASKINIFIIAFILIYAFIFPIYSNFHCPGSLYYILFISSFLLLIFYVFYKIYKTEKKNQLEQIYEILDIEYEKEVLSREWSVKNIITRALLYPISIALLLVSIFYMIPIGEYILAIFCFIFFGSYLFIDLKILFSKRKNN